MSECTRTVTMQVCDGLSLSGSGVVTIRDVEIRAPIVVSHDDCDVVLVNGELFSVQRHGRPRADCLALAPWGTPFSAEAA